MEIRNDQRSSAQRMNGNRGWGKAGVMEAAEQDLGKEHWAARAVRDSRMGALLREKLLLGPSRFPGQTQIPSQPWDKIQIPNQLSLPG